MINIAHLSYDPKSQKLSCLGSWTYTGKVDVLEKTIEHYKNYAVQDMDLAQIEALDIGGALLLKKLFAQFPQVAIQNLDTKHEALLKILEKHSVNIFPMLIKTTILEYLGRKSFAALSEMQGFLIFIAKIVFSFRIHILKEWRWILQMVEVVGYQALPIIGLLSFLIGIVLAYQMGLQLRTYGANIYIVDLTGLAVLREFSPLITAIIIAGRSGSAITAQIGTMQLNQEIDALQVLGISPLQHLVLPYIIALGISLPLLTIWSDIIGVLGSMCMSSVILHLPAAQFIHRFAEVTTVRTFILGLIKTPIFAIVIASIAAFHGFQIKQGASQLGARTTASVVHAIFCIICIDAFFSILYSWYGI